ncbi:MAG: hypothetical protein AAGA91_09575 [Pseudomonadota bacterium]
MKIWLYTLFLLPALAWGDSNVPAHDDNTRPDPGETGREESSPESLNWVDSSHAYASNQAQALAEWMDNYFGDPNYELEQPESLVRLEWANDWDQEDGYKSKLKLRGKLQLPALSRRLNLVFNGDDGDSLADDDNDDNEGVALVYNLDDKKRSRVDLTLGASWGNLRPGIRYRNQGPIAERYSYRYTQRLQWDFDNGLFTTGQVNLDHALSDNELVRWSNRARYGEETDGVEWRSRLSLRKRYREAESGREMVVSYFAVVKGITDPDFVKNYRFGFQVRRQVYRDFLYVELEPAYNFRKRKDEDRRNVWTVSLRFEIALHKDLARDALTRD